MLEQQRIPLGSRQLNRARGASNGPPLVFLHGVTRRWQTFTPLIPALNPRWEIHALDFRGHGASGHVPERYQVLDYVEDAVEYLEQLWKPAVLYGHSLGAMVALAVAARAGERVRAIILEDPPFDTMGSRIGETQFLSMFQGFQEVKRTARTFEQASAAIAELRVQGPDDPQPIRLGDVRTESSIWFTAQSLLLLDAGVLEPIVQGTWLTGYHLEEFPGAVRCPVLLLQADYEHGGMLTDDDAGLLASSLRSLLWTSRPVKFPAKPHLLHWTATAELLSSVQEFLATV